MPPHRKYNPKLEPVINRLLEGKMLPKAKGPLISTAEEATHYARLIQGSKDFSKTRKLAALTEAMNLSANSAVLRVFEKERTLLIGDKGSAKMVNDALASASFGEIRNPIHSVRRMKTELRNVSHLNPDTRGKLTGMLGRAVTPEVMQRIELERSKAIGLANRKEVWNFLSLLEGRHINEAFYAIEKGVPLGEIYRELDRIEQRGGGKRKASILWERLGDAMRKNYRGPDNGALDPHIANPKSLMKKFYVKSRRLAMEIGQHHDAIRVTNKMTEFR